MRKRGLLRVAAIWGAGLLCASAAFADPIVNGDFSAGNSGFASGYTFVTSSSNTNCYPEGSYSVTTNPINCHNLWSSFGDHTTGTGNMLIVNGAPAANVPVWSESLAVQANTQYFFSAWVASTYTANPAQLNFLINGSQVGGTFTASTTTGLWQQFTASWNSGSNTTAALGIVDQNIIRSGNDFALDDLAFSSVPEPASWILLCILTPALLFWQRRRSARAQ